MRGGSRPGEWIHPENRGPAMLPQTSDSICSAGTAMERDTWMRLRGWIAKDPHSRMPPIARTSLPSAGYFTGDSPAFGDITAIALPYRVLINVFCTPVALSQIASIGASYRSLWRIGTGKQVRLCFDLIAVTCKVSEGILLRCAAEPSSRCDLSFSQDRHSLGAI